MSERGLVRKLDQASSSVRQIQTLDPQKRLMATLLSLPQLRAAWTMGQIDYQAANQVLDLGGGGYHLTNVNTTTFCDDNSAPYANFNVTNLQYLNRADGGAGNWADIIGNEAYILAAQRGLTLGGWFMPYRLTNAEHLIGKTDGTPANSSYWIQFRGDAADQFRMNVSTGAATIVVDQIPSGGTSIDHWYYVVGRYDPGTELKIYVGSGGALESNTNLVGVPAALVDSTAAFTIGATSVPSQHLDGRASCCFLCASLLSDSWIRCLYSQTRSIYRI